MTKAGRHTKAVRPFSGGIRRGVPAIRPASALLVWLMLTGCSAPLANAPIIGEPANTPARAETAPSYLPVHDVPPPREEAVPPLEERTKLQKELLAARDRQNAQAEALAKGSSPVKKKAAPAKPARGQAKDEGTVAPKDASR